MPEHKPVSKPIDYKSMNLVYQKPIKPITNYTLSSVCPACGHDTFKLACKVRCPKCNFMWDCSEL